MFDTIVEICIVYDLKDYVNNKLKVDNSILNRINDADDFELF